MAETIMSGNRKFTTSNITNYALFAGGLEVTHNALMNYDPLINGYGRLFMVRKPVWLDEYFKDGKLDIFKHMLEYGNTGVSGINDIQVEFDPISGGYTGKSMDIPTNVKDGTDSFSVKLYEFTGSPIREVVHTWITGSIDLNSGLTHYHGVDDKLPRIQANQTAEFIYIMTDRTGTEVEYACMFANCFPKEVKEDHFNYDAGTHNIVQIDLNFTCAKYESLAINYYAKKLLDKFKILSNHLNFNPGLNDQFLQTDNSPSPSKIGSPIDGQSTSTVPFTESECKDAANGTVQE